MHAESDLVLMDAEREFAGLSQNPLQRAHARRTESLHVLEIPLDNLAHLFFAQGNQNRDAAGRGNERSARADLYGLREPEPPRSAESSV